MQGGHEPLKMIFLFSTQYKIKPHPNSHKDDTSLCSWFIIRNIFKPLYSQTMVICGELQWNAIVWTSYEVGWPHWRKQEDCDRFPDMTGNSELAGLRNIKSNKGTAKLLTKNLYFGLFYTFSSRWIRYSSTISIIVTTSIQIYKMSKKYLWILEYLDCFSPYLISRSRRKSL